MTWIPTKRMPRTSSNSCDTDRLSIGIDYSPYEALGESIRESIIKTQLNIDTIAQTLQSTCEAIVNTANVLVNAAYKIKQILTNIIPTDYFQDIITAWQEILNNPNSVINYTNYENKLDNFHWAWPFQFDASAIKELTETVNDEKDFDKWRCGQEVGLDTLKREIERCIQKNNITKLSRFTKRRDQSQRP